MGDAGFLENGAIRGELTSSVSMEELLQTNLDETVQLLRDSHTTLSVRRWG